jgi:hypothetical protein
MVNRNKVYQFSTPDYLKINSSSKKTLLTSESRGSGSKPPVTVISRTNGWLTVDAETLNRRFAIEKDTKINIRQSSKLAPPWMLTGHTPDKERLKMFKP